MLLNEVDLGAASYREWFSRLLEFELPVADGNPLLVTFASREPMPPSNELAIHVAGQLLTGQPVAIAGAAGVPLYERLRLFDEVASLLPSGMRADLQLTTSNAGQYGWDARLFFSDQLSPRTRSVQWEEPNKGTFLGPRIEAYTSWLREDLPDRMTQLAAMTRARRFDRDGVEATLGLVPRQERPPLGDERQLHEHRLELAPGQRRVLPTPGEQEDGRNFIRDMLLPQHRAQRAIEAAVKRGLLVFNPPAEMRQGSSDRLEVGIARSPDLKEVLLEGLRGHGHPLFEEIRTSSVMRVELKGEAFGVISHSAAEQIVAPTARWEFDVIPRRAGVHTLILCVCLFLKVAGLTASGEGLISEPVLERSVRVRVSVGYSTQRFVATNWQWLIATIVGLAGGISAWIALVH